VITISNTSYTCKLVIFPATGTKQAICVIHMSHFSFWVVSVIIVWGRFLISVWAVLNCKWAVLIIQNGLIWAILDLSYGSFLTFAWAVLVLGRFDHFPFLFYIHVRCVSKNIPNIIDYNLNKDYQSLMFFGTNISDVHVT